MFRWFPVCKHDFLCGIAPTVPLADVLAVVAHIGVAVDFCLSLHTSLSFQWVLRQGHPVCGVLNVTAAYDREHIGGAIPVADLNFSALINQDILMFVRQAD